MRFARRWWPLTGFLIPIVTIQHLWFGGYNAAGHAAGHLASASAIFGVAYVISVIVWAARPDLRRRAGLWLLSSAVVAAAIIPTIGNLRVVDAIGTDNWTDDQASARGISRPGFASGHDLAERGMWVVVASAVLLAGWLWWRRAVRNKAAVAAIFLSVIFPPWILPGAGLVVIAVTILVDRARRIRPDAADPAEAAVLTESSPRTG
jgi:hypothetical protein